MTKKNQAIIHADKIGYYCDHQGNIYSPYGAIQNDQHSIQGRKLSLYEKSGYKAFSVNLNGQKITVSAHRFIAYQKYGAMIFQEGVEVRHLDDDKNNNSWHNIGFGTSSQNKMDTPRSKRIKKATHAINSRWKNAA